MNNFGKNLALWVIIGLLLIALFNLFQFAATEERFAPQLRRGQDVAVADAVRHAALDNLAATVADFIRVYRGDLTLRSAMAEDRLEVIGDAGARRSLAAWLNLSPLAEVRSRRAG